MRLALSFCIWAVIFFPCLALAGQLSSRNVVAGLFGFAFGQVLLALIRGLK